ncbi:hypothetical protein Lal_00038474 [Lupinus albus]|nr:hypothetical protein Lal_00038474 [Lupinus albus]
MVSTEWKGLCSINHSPTLGLRLKVALLIHPVFQGEEFKELVASIPEKRVGIPSYVISLLPIPIPSPRKSLRWGRLLPGGIKFGAKACSYRSLTLLFTGIGIYFTRWNKDQIFLSLNLPWKGRNPYFIELNTGAYLYRKAVNEGTELDLEERENLVSSKGARERADLVASDLKDRNELNLLQQKSSHNKLQLDSFQWPKGSLKTTRLSVLAAFYYILCLDLCFLLYDALPLGKRGTLNERMKTNSTSANAVGHIFLRQSEQRQQRIKELLAPLVGGCAALPGHRAYPILNLESNPCRHLSYWLLKVLADERDIPRMPPFRAYLTCLQLLWVFSLLSHDAISGPPRPALSPKPHSIYIPSTKSSLPAQMRQSAYRRASGMDPFLMPAGEGKEKRPTTRGESDSAANKRRFFMK